MIFLEGLARTRPELAGFRAVRGKGPARGGMAGSSDKSSITHNTHRSSIIHCSSQRIPRRRISFTFVEEGPAKGGRATQQGVELLQCCLLVNPKFKIKN